MTLYPGIDAGPKRGGVALVGACDDGFACTPADALAWTDEAGAKRARAWLAGRFAGGGVSNEWHIEKPFVLSSRPGAGAAQFESLVDWSYQAGSSGAELVQVPVVDWRADYSVPGDDAARASRAWVAFLFPSIPLGEGDHLSDAVLLALRNAGGVGWATRRLAAARGDDRARAVMLACAARRGRKRKGGPAEIPDWIRNHQARFGRGGDLR